MNLKLTILVLVVAIDFISISDAANSSEDAAKAIRKRYNDSKKHCTSKSGHLEPAYKCSGILIRGIREKITLDHSWSMKRANRKKKSFALAFLRKDAKFESLPRHYSSGFIIYPQSQTPKTETKYNILCAFPLDAHSDERRGRHGCGKSIGVKGKSGLCNKQNINTFKKWKKHFQEITKHPANATHNPVTRQCGFDTTGKKGYKLFEVFLEASEYLMNHGKDNAYRNNELRMHIWNKSKAKRIPIEAFFYMLGSKEGQKRAVKFRADFKKSGGGDKPIVGIRLPTKTGGKFKVVAFHQKKKKSSKNGR